MSDISNENKCSYSQGQCIKCSSKYQDIDQEVVLTGTNIILVGLNHTSASVDLREKLAFNYEQAEKALKTLKSAHPECGFVLLSTCNRTELYCSVDKENNLTTQSLIHEFISLRAIGLAEYFENSYAYQGRDAVRHLLEVAGSLDSLVLGESQIIAQVRDAYYLASRVGATDKVINRLFHCAFTCSKEIYSTTSISQRRVSVASVAVEYIGKLFDNLTDKKAVVIGAGEMGELITRHLKSNGVENITIINRTIKRSQLIAERLDLGYADWDDLKTYIAKADIIVGAANAGEMIFDRSYIPEYVISKKVIVDIAVPRNFSPELSMIDNIYLYSIDDLSQVVKDNMMARREDIDQARQIVEDDTDSFLDWFGVMDVGPMAGKLRCKFHNMALAELNYLNRNLRDLDETGRQLLDASVKRLVNKYLHSLINGFHQHAREVDPKAVVKLMKDIIEQEHRD